MAKVKFTAGRIAEFSATSSNIPSFLWDSEAPGLGLRAAPGGKKVYVFQAKLKGQVIRVKLGTPLDLTIEEARAKATEHRKIINDGQDPRQVKADKLEAEEAARETREAEKAAKQVQEMRESVTLGDVWPLYVADRSPVWSELHRRDHLRIMQAGGETRKRSKKLTEAGPLASLATCRLVELTTDRIEDWAKTEAETRPTSARLALRLLKACLNWCATHKSYSGIVKENPTQSKKARESLGKSKVKHDVLQREQLTAWFAAARQIGNPVISAYLQGLLITGARREELAKLKWGDVDFRWNSLKLSDKVEEFRMVPLTPYLAQLLANLPRRGEWVFSSPSSESGRLMEPSIAHRKACSVAGLDLSLHGLRRSFASLCEWTETPAGIAAQIQGHAPQGVREQNYIRRSLDLLRMWHVKIEAWMLEQAGINFVPSPQGARLIAVA